MSTQPPKARVLVVEDEASLLRLIELSLLAEGYEVIKATDGREALKRFRETPNIQLVILDIMLPQLDGFSVLQEIRKFSDVPVILLTALGSTDDMVKGFTLGADDYITKPFTFREVTARIEAILRRMRWMQQPQPQVFRHGDLQLDLQNHEVLVRGKPCHMTPIEFSLLHYFMSHPNQVISKDDLFREVWGYEFEGSTNLVEVGVRRLREKIELDPSQPQYIRTIRGVGYKYQYQPSEERQTA
jgi:DNA-binding response OmpR family regulator